MKTNSSCQRDICMELTLQLSDRFWTCLKFSMQMWLLSAELYKTQQMFHDMATRSQREMAAALGENKRLREEVSEFKSEVAEVRDAFTNLTAFIHAQLSNTSAGAIFFYPMSFLHPCHVILCRFHAIWVPKRATCCGCQMAYNDEMHL